VPKRHHSVTDWTIWITHRFIKCLKLVMFIVTYKHYRHFLFFFVCFPFCPSPFAGNSCSFSVAILLGTNGLWGTCEGSVKFQNIRTLLCVPCLNYAANLMACIQYHPLHWCFKDGDKKKAKTKIHKSKQTTVFSDRMKVFLIKPNRPLKLPWPSQEKYFK